MTNISQKQGYLPHSPAGFFIPADLIHGSVPPWGALMCLQLLLWC